MNRIAWAALGIFGVVSLAGGVVRAQRPLRVEDVPPPLRPWVDYALDGDRSFGCAWVGGEQHCVWPGALRLDFADTEGSFELELRADDEADVPLPGGPGLVPTGVTVDGRPSTLARSGADVLSVRVPAGTHRVAGRFSFPRIPELLPLPPELALVRLRKGGQDVPARRNEAGDLWLRSVAEESDGEEGGLQLEVHRQVQDGVPFSVTTRVTLRASGEPRETTLGTVALPGLTVTELRSDLAARLDPETGALTVQIRPGSFVITLVARSGRPLDALSPPAQAEPWPAEEIWVWAPDEALRQVEVSGASAIDASRTNLPEEWSERTAYVLTADRTLTFETTRRGEPSPSPNALELERELWLDFDGYGYTGRDRLHGRMNQGWRLELREGELGRVEVGGDDQLITQGDSGRGVEIRQRNVNVEADWRLEEARSSLPAVGWSEDVQSLSATLHLPAGWTLLGASGVDELPGTWLDQWDLWSIFFVLVISLAIGRLSHPALGVLALVTLTLCYYEDGAPFASWMLFIPLLALRGVIPIGRIQKTTSFFLWGSVVLLLWVSMPFAVSQLRNALYPFTAHAAVDGSIDAGFGGLSDRRQEEVATTEELYESEPEPSIQNAPGAPAGRYGIQGDLDDAETAQAGRERASSSSSRAAPPPPGESGWVDPNAVVQTGPGVPTWRFRQHTLRWSGPVRADHRIELVLLPPWLFRILAVLRVLLLAGLVLLLLTRYVPPPPKPKSEPRPGPAPGAKPPPTAAAGTALALLALLGAVPARAQIPSASQLEDLASRMTRAPECGGDCVMATTMDLRVDAQDRLVIDAEVHARAQVGFRLPGPSERWVPEEVSVDGRSTTALRRGPGGFLFVRLEEGVRRVRLEGPLSGDTLTLALGASAARVRVEAEGWDVGGVRADGRASETIQLQRLAPSTASEDAPAEVALPAWLVVRRRIELGVRWRVQTSVERVTPAGSAVVLRLPLLEGESVTDADVQVEDDALVVSLGRDDESVSWTSSLEPGEGLVLQAGEGERYSEAWTLACSPIWRCAAEGIAPVDRGDELATSRYRPWPGERLSIATSRPPGAEGRASTIDRAQLVLSPGVRMLRAELDVRVRASQGITQTLALPEGATVQSLQVRGESRPVQEAEGTLRVGLEPGTSDIRVEWQEPRGLRPHFETPRVRLGDALVNARVELRVPRERWILWAHGPSSGVAVLFWPYLLLVLGVAIVLGRTKRTPLGTLEWFVLGIGLTQIPALAALVVVGWFFLMDRRGRTPDVDARVFPLRQLALAGYTFVALVCLYAALHIGLLMQPDMQILSLHGGDQLIWYLDRTGGTLPQPSLWSVPLWVWRVVMLVWALWLALRLFAWGKWGWGEFSKGGWLTGGTPPPPPPRPLAPIGPQGRPPVSSSAVAPPRPPDVSTSRGTEGDIHPPKDEDPSP